MNRLATIWGCILFLNFSSKHFPLLFADCGSFIAHGYLTVEPAPLFLLGSHLRVYCHIYECKWGSKMSLELRNDTVTLYNLSQRINCTTALLTVPPVLIPQSSAVCKMRTDQKSNWIVVNGLDLHAGLPPDKPANITCETTRSSNIISCTWKRGRETHLPRSYNVSLSGNETQKRVGHIQNAEIIHIPRTTLHENTKYQLSVEAYNHFGTSRSDPYTLYVRDVVIPETPDNVTIEFMNISIKAVLRWKSPESAAHLRSHVRFRTKNKDIWVEIKGELKENLVIVDNLKPLTEYEFQIRVCDSGSGHTNASTPSFSMKPRCSRWSSSFQKTSPGKGPSQPLQVWRILEGHGKNSLRNVTVLWKPPSPEDYNGEILHYKVLMKNFHEKICTAASNMCSVLVPEEVQALSVSAVTPYGTSPPAEVEIRQSGASGSCLQELIPTADDSSLLVSWSSTTGELLYHIIEWTSLSVAELQWKKLDKNQTSTLITGLTAGVRFNVSLYDATSKGVSAPSSSLVYSREEKPTSGPMPYVLVHKTRRLLIQWNELPMDQQRGFIINYTIFLQKLGSSDTEQRVTASGYGPRQMWLDCPEGALALQMTATNSAGEGPRGTRICSQPAAPAVGLVVLIVFTAAIFLVAVANLMCCNCVRKRIKQKFLSWRPTWLVVNLPKPGHSNAIRLLQNDSSEPVLSSTNDSDPPLSPITVISQEMDDVYPTIHVDLSQIDSGACTSMSETGPLLAEHAGYKPQTATLDPVEEEVIDDEEEQRETAENPEKDHFSSSCGDLLSDLLSSVEVEYSDTFQGLTFSSIAGLLWPKSVETNILSSIFLQGKRTTSDCVEANSASMDSSQELDTRTSHTADISLSWCAGEIKQDSGYFPQVTAVSDTSVNAEQQQKQRE